MPLNYRLCPRVRPKTKESVKVYTRSHLVKKIGLNCFHGGK